MLDVLGKNALRLACRKTHKTGLERGPGQVGSVCSKCEGKWVKGYGWGVNHWDSKALWREALMCLILLVRDH